MSGIFRGRNLIPPKEIVAVEGTTFIYGRHLVTVPGRYKYSVPEGNGVATFLMSSPSPKLYITHDGWLSVFKEASGPFVIFVKCANGVLGSFFGHVVNGPIRRAVSIL